LIHSGQLTVLFVHPVECVVGKRWWRSWQPCTSVCRLRVCRNVARTSDAILRTCGMAGEVWTQVVGIHRKRSAAV